MANYSYNYLSSLNRMFTNQFCPTFNQINTGLSRSGYIKRLEFDISTGELEIPIFILGTIRDWIRNNSSYVKEGKVKKLVVNIGVAYDRWENDKHVAGPDTLISHFSRVGGGPGLVKAYLKNTVYYGNCGLIVDKDFNVLVMTTAKIRFSILEEGRNPRNRDYSVQMEFSDPKVYINPKIFTEDSVSLHKSITRKMIGCFLTNPVEVIGGYWINESAFSVPNIIIQDVTPMFKETQKPNEFTDFKALNTCLKDNIPLITGIVDGIFKYYELWNRS